MGLKVLIMFSGQWLKAILPIVVQYFKEFLFPTSEENKTTKGERIIALVIALLVLCLTSILERTITINGELTKTKATLLIVENTLKEKRTLIKSISFYLDRCDRRVTDIASRLIPEIEAIEVSPSMHFGLIEDQLDAPHPYIPQKPELNELSPYNQSLLNSITKDN